MTLMLASTSSGGLLNNGTILFIMPKSTIGYEVGISGEGDYNEPTDIKFIHKYDRAKYGHHNKDAQIMLYKSPDLTVADLGELVLDCVEQGEIKNITTLQPAELLNMFHMILRDYLLGTIDVEMGLK